MTLHENQFYCVKCKHKEVVRNPDNICVKYYKRRSRSGKSGSPNRKQLTTVALVGNCAKCHTKLHKFVKRDDANRLEKKYGKCGSRKRSRKHSRKHSKKHSKKHIYYK